MQEDGTLSLLKKKWWKDMHGGGCDDAEEGGSSADLKLANVGGVFLVLGVGVSVAFIFSLIEFLWNVHTVAVEQKVTHKEAMATELKFAFKVWITQKRTSQSSEPSSRADNTSLSRKDAISLASYEDGHNH